MFVSTPHTILTVEHARNKTKQQLIIFFTYTKSCAFVNNFYVRLWVCVLSYRKVLYYYMYKAYKR